MIVINVYEDYDKEYALLVTYTIEGSSIPLEKGWL